LESSYGEYDPKKIALSKDPKNYRPISQTSCVSKLIERVIKNNLVEFLNFNKIIIEEQSGFQKNRRTTDNLIFLTQKAIESVNRNKKCLTIFFDIEKAFDKVWHYGLIYKLIEYKIPNFIVKWVFNYLKDRKMYVRINDETSEKKLLQTGVPQGGVLSPILFSIFINNIPIKNVKNVSCSLLFADDLATMFFYSKEGKVKHVIANYLKDIEKWLVKWKLKMSGTKCSYMCFSKSSTKVNFVLKLFDEVIPYNKSCVFLGVMFDDKLSFNLHLEYILKKIFNRQNLLKILAHRKWRLSYSTLLMIYYSLIRSLIDYVSFIGTTLSESIRIKFQRIQNQAIKTIYHCPLLTNLKKLEEEIGLINISGRMNSLTVRYLNISLSNNNPLIYKLCQEYKKGFEAREVKFKSSPLCCIKDKIFAIDFNE
jgi:hypothetical protein